MSEAVIGPSRVALVGNPNSGKTALFNALTGARQKVANYAGVTVERKEGVVTTVGGRHISVLDLPGTTATTPPTPTSTCCTGSRRTWTRSRSATTARRRP